MTQPTTEQIQAILKHLTVLKRPRLLVSTWHSGKSKDGTLVLPSEERSPKIEALIADLYKHNFVIGFDWPSWQRTAAKYVEHKSRKVKIATLGTLVKLLTTHVRKDRFCEGHFSGMVRSGHILAILERLNGLLPSPKIPKTATRFSHEN